jgi:alpha-N-acetylglucosamine transferase
VQFEKCVFLDADCLVLKNVDELFEREEFSAVTDIGWPDCFNSGVFVFRPSLDTYSSLVKFAVESGSFDGNEYFLKIVSLFIYLFKTIAIQQFYLIIKQVAIKAC